MLKYFINIVLLLLLAAGCQKPAEVVLTNGQLTRITTPGAVQLINSEGEPVLLVAGQEITSDDMINEPASLGSLYVIPGQYLEPIAQGFGIEQFKDRIREHFQLMLADKIRYILLYKSAKERFKDSLDESVNKAVESELRRFYQRFGGDQAQAEAAIRRNWIDRESYKKLLTQEILTEWYISSHQTSNSYVSYRQLKQQYESMKKEYFEITPTIQFKLIDIQPARLELPDPNTERGAYAEKLAADIYARLKSGEDFAELAGKYSQGPKRQFGGAWDSMNPDSLAEPYDSIAKAANDMNPGDISKPIEAGNHIFIVELESKESAGFVPFEEVQDQVREALIAKQDNNSALNRLDEYVMHQMELDETNAFVDFCLEKIYRNSNKGEE